MKRTLGIILALGWGIFGCSCGSKEQKQSIGASSKSEKTVVVSADSPRKNDKKVPLKTRIVGQNSKHSPIFRTGYSYITWELNDTQAKMYCDIDQDGTLDEELFFVMGSQENTLPAKVIYRKGAVEQDLMPLILKKEFVAEWFDEMTPEYATFELTFYDFDKDGKLELICSFADGGSAAMKANVFRFIGKKKGQPWEFMGDLSGQYELYISEENGLIIAPIGSQGLFEAYRFDGKQFMDAEDSFSN